MIDDLAYRDQTDAVRARFDKLKARDVALRIEGLGKTFRLPNGETTIALHGIDLTTHRREFLCVVGPSGCGKSTFVRILAGLDTATSGVVLVDDKPVVGPCSDLGMVFQGYTLFSLAERPEERHVRPAGAGGKQPDRVAQRPANGSR